MIIGTARSGKSEYAEQRVMELSSRRVYLAVSEIYDEEMARRVELHRERRKGKGFATIERPRDLGGAELPEDSCVLIESLGVWLSNEMFRPDGEVNLSAGEKVYRDLVKIVERVRDVVVVSDDVFSDGMEYDALTEEWVRTLGGLHVRIAEIADEVMEVVAGLPVRYKPS
ncbi:MAG: bifunctional adenosylcobinamide kinase/adenosylcobinamide-phosphate guanylyltransferase [Synergistaceae bacterium]|nr:bifunctional adenosylcobinamide kinase/adenosylcobinamide-phosphate guanylyltransferase [Synergistaceae bacterium]